VITATASPLTLGRVLAREEGGGTSVVLGSLAQALPTSALRRRRRTALGGPSVGMTPKADQERSGRGFWSAGALELTLLGEWVVTTLFMLLGVIGQLSKSQPK
jgi:hypothetical protein